MGVLGGQTFSNGLYSGLNTQYHFKEAHIITRILHPNRLNKTYLDINEAVKSIKNLPYMKYLPVNQQLG